MNETASDDHIQNEKTILELELAREKASHSMMFGLSSLLFSLLTGTFGLVLGISALRINKRYGATTGNTKALIGIVTSLVFSIFSGTAMLILCGISLAKSADSESSNRLRQLTLSFRNYETAHMEFPTDRYAKDGTPLLSWRVEILPFLGDEARKLHKQFNLEEPWDSRHNLEVAKQMPAAFERPGCWLENGMTVYQRPVGNNAFFEIPQPGEKERPIPVGAVIDGMGNTIMFVESNPENAVFWTQPQKDYNFDPQNPIQGLSASRFGLLLFAMGDGSVHSMGKNTLTDEQFTAAFTRSMQDNPDSNRQRRRR